MSLFLKSKNFIKKNEKYITPTALFGGFVIDTFTLQRIDLLFENIILGGYLFISGILIFLTYLLDKDKLNNRFLIKIEPFISVFILILFGGIFSGFTIFYTRSSSIISSWPFLLLLVGVMIGTEYLKKHFSKSVIQVSVFYFALFTYLIFAVPIVLKSISVWVFLLSGGFSLLIFFLYTKLFDYFVKDKFKVIKRSVWNWVFGIFALINIFYFTNIIPPIPLSLKNAEVLHYIERTSGEYSVLAEQENFLEKIIPGQTINIEKGKPVYFFSSVFAPTDLNTRIVHNWQYKTEDGWETQSRIPFSIVGGADNGYRGYSVKSSLLEGRWRVNVETPSGKTIGREDFIVKFVNKTPILVAEKR